MKSLDTNIIIRIMVRDDEAQALRAEQILRGPTLLLVTVMIEAFWVLHRGYRWSADQIVAGFSTILSSTMLTCPDAQAIRWALGRFSAGADFAHMLHLTLSSEADCFVTFDKRIARHADASVVPVETLA